MIRAINIALILFIFSTLLTAAVLLMTGCFGHDNRILDDIEHPQRLDGLEASG
jgi:hypothetical protein